ncbi:Hypothetical predicted protein [Pelobates cultripes]|uniref:Uncharacterized protein n=1 Tax=Pelobates cultripes TaxID=61616 RepID=A0AAD1TLM9_PELCU|nr:Hypothetical predicted protein [Pelobates cultripes]
MSAQMRHVVELLPLAYTDIIALPLRTRRPQVVNCFPGLGLTPGFCLSWVELRRRGGENPLLPRSCVRTGGRRVRSV